MKKFTSVLLIGSLSATMALFTGCSSSPISSEAADLDFPETAMMDPALNGDPGAVLDAAPTHSIAEDPAALADAAAPVPVLTADASPTLGTMSDAAPVSLGATSAGRSQ